MAPKPRFYCLLAVSVLLLLAGQVSEAAKIISIDVTGDWSVTIDASYLQAGAGSDLRSSYESAGDAALLTIVGTQNKHDVWQVDIRRTDTTWPSDLTLSVRRTGAGTGNGGISGGAAYQEIGTTDTEFFSGTGDRSGIPLQFKLEGMSLQVPPNTYSTTITYTVVDIP